MRAVLDPNVLISALLSGTGTPAKILRAWRAGAFELIVSPASLDELSRALGYPKLRRYVSIAEARAFVEHIEATAVIVEDPNVYPLSVRSRDPGDDYLLALASASSSVLVTGDDDIIELGREVPIHSPASFLALVGSGP